ncbi:GNAT family N-acetyltransferase [Streptomyces sp. NPDC051954]|uniref:GNAT family N-acetyltransferase n=1 Tax=Streptomyces sp. NPDC051954 TaxID=3155524 RepID=UPI003441F68F
MSARSGWRVNTGTFPRDRFRAVPRTDTPATSPTHPHPQAQRAHPTNRNRPPQASGPTGSASFRTPDGAPPDAVTLFQFHVDPGRWRSGVGTSLHTACVEQWRADGKSTAVLDVHVDNRRAQAFYGSRGWVAEPSGEGHHLRLRLTVDGE